MSKFNAGQSFSNGDTVTGPTLNNITGLLDIYTGLISEQTAIVATVSTADQLLIADTDNGDSGAANRVTVQKLLNDTLTNGTYTNAQLSGNLNVTQLSTLGTISSTTGTIQTLTSSTANISQGSAIFTQGTIATLNSTTGTIGTLVATGTITGSTNVVNIGSGQIYKDATGNVGIGTTSPIVVAGYTSLTLDGTTSGLLEIKSNGTQKGVFFNDGVTRLRSSGTLAFDANNTEAMRIDSSGNVGINTTTGSAKLDVRTTGDGNWAARFLNATGSDSPNGVQVVVGQNSTNVVFDVAQGTSYASPTSLLRVLGNGYVLVNKTTAAFGTAGVLLGSAVNEFTVSTSNVQNLNRTGNDGTLVAFHQDGTVEGSISVSGTTVSYNGGHLSRWSQLLSGQRDASIKKGTVMCNLNEMCEWFDKDGNLLPNEQLNKVKVSDVEGENNIAGVFVNWDDDDKDNPYDLNMAMTGDMIIRIAQGTSVNRGDLLMSAGDGTAKPQGDDIIRSKTIAKVTSTNVTCTYEDGSYCVPCVLMAC